MRSKIDLSPRRRSVSEKLPRVASRSTTEFWSQYTTQIPSEETNILYDKDDTMRILLHDLTKRKRKFQLIDAQNKKTAQKEAEKIKGIRRMESLEILQGIPRQIQNDWNQRVSENKTLWNGLKNGTMDERKLRNAFGVNEEDKVMCKWVDQYLVSKESVETLLMPTLSSWDEMLEMFGSHGNFKACAPVYWKDEVSRGRGERARLIKVGVDIPAIWEIHDAEQLVTADLYLTFTWKVKAIRNDIWDNMSREFIKPVWKVRLRNGKFIANLKNYCIMDEDLSCGDEKEGFTTIIQRITITAQFSQSFNMQRFPFDEQKIEFIIRYWLIPYRSRHGEKRGRLIFYEDIAWEIRVKDCALKPSDEWSLIRQPGDKYDKLDFSSDLTIKKMDPKRGRRWPEIRFSFMTARNPEFMKWNVALPISMVVVFGLLGNLTAFNNEFDRTSFTAALLFTIFSIKSNVQYALSKVGYRTTLDSYILLSQAMIIMQGLVGVLFSHISEEDEDNTDKWDDFMLLIIFGAGGLFCWAIITYRFWIGKNLLDC